MPTRQGKHHKLKFQSYFRLLEEIDSPKVNEILDSNRQTKPTTPINILNVSPTKASRSLSSSFADSAEINQMMTRTRSPRDTPQRKYFDSGDWELAKAGKVDAASVGSEHASPEKLHSRSFSSQQLHPSNAAQISRSLSHGQNSPIKISFSAASLDANEAVLKFPESISEDVDMG
jgi:hypothetical protein